MTDKEKKYLSDILHSVHLIHSFTEKITSFEQYKGDPLVKGAVERHLGIIGEAVNKFLKESPKNTLTHAQQIISLRNRIIHAYDNIDDRIIWTIVKKHLNPLKEEIERMM
jgi:uncharacterized protein with HEPN domain